MLPLTVMEWFMSKRRPASGWSQWFVLLLAGVLVSLFAGILTSSTPVFAADATWNAGNIEKDSQVYSPSSNPALVKSLGLPDGSQIWSTPYDTTKTAGKQSVKIIHLPSGTDAATTTTVSLSEYSFTPPDTWVRTSTGSTPIDASTYQEATGSSQSCNVDSVGWMICGPSMLIANGMDGLYSQLSTLMETPAVNLNDKTSGIYIAWKIMLDLANIVFIILFLIVIYSHVTSLGLSNYGIKKILPRVVIVVVAINLSLFLCSLFIELSNITGFALQDMFNDIREHIIDQSKTQAGGAWPPTWGDVTAGILAGGAGVMGGYLAFGATQGVMGSALVALIPILLGVVLTLVVVFVILAARQALIVIFTIISPLAIACYLLPGTESWFKKWRSTFFTLLLFFPAFSVVFGGAQLAGLVIIQNASSMLMLLLGMAVQIAPLAIAPLVFKLGGGLLNRFAGIMNDKNKGFLDRTKKWSDQQSKYLANKKNGILSDEEFKKKKWRPMRTIGRWANQTQRARDERIANYQARADAAYESSTYHGKNDSFSRETDQKKSLGEKTLEKSWNDSLLKNQALSQRNLHLRSMTDQADSLSKRVDARYEDFKTGREPLTGSMSELQQATIAAQDDAFLTDQRMGMAKASQSQRIAQRMKQDTYTIANDQGDRIKYRDYAGGVLGSEGAAAALASAIASRNKSHNEGVQESMVIQEHFKLTGEERNNLIKGGAVAINDERGTYSFEASDETIMEAAAAKQMAIGTFQQKLEVIKRTNQFYLDDQGNPAGTTFAIRSEVSDGAAKNGIAKTAVWLGGKSIEDMNQGTFTIQSAIQQTLIKGKVKDVELATNDFEAIRMMFEQDGEGLSDTDRAKFETNKQHLRYSAWRIMHDPQLFANTSTNSQEVLQAFAERPPQSTS